MEFAERYSTMLLVADLAAYTMGVLIVITLIYGWRA